MAVTKSPKRIPNTIKLKGKFGNEIIYQRQGKGRLASLVPLFILRTQTPEKQRVHLVSTALVTINKVSGPVMAGMLDQATKRESIGTSRAFLPRGPRDPGPWLQTL